MQKFKANEFNCLISTCIGEEGFDIGEVDLIVCYDATKSPLRLIQRVGRTGRKRDGRVVFLLTEGIEEIAQKTSENKKQNIKSNIFRKHKFNLQSKNDSLFKSSQQFKEQYYFIEEEGPIVPMPDAPKRVSSTPKSSSKKTNKNGKLDDIVVKRTKLNFDASDEQDEKNLSAEQISDDYSCGSIFSSTNEAQTFAENSELLVDKNDNVSIDHNFADEFLNSLISNSQEKKENSLIDESKSTSKFQMINSLPNLAHSYDKNSDDVNDDEIILISNDIEPDKNSNLEGIKNCQKNIEFSDTLDIVDLNSVANSTILDNDKENKPLTDKISAKNVEIFSKKTKNWLKHPPKEPKITPNGSSIVLNTSENFDSESKVIEKLKKVAKDHENASKSVRKSQKMKKNSNPKSQHENMNQNTTIIDTDNSDCDYSISGDSDIKEFLDREAVSSFDESQTMTQNSYHTQTESLTVCDSIVVPDGVVSQIPDSIVSTQAILAKNLQVAKITGPKRPRKSVTDYQILEEINPYSQFPGSLDNDSSICDYSFVVDDDVIPEEDENESNIIKSKNKQKNVECIFSDTDEIAPKKSPEKSKQSEQKIERKADEKLYELLDTSFESFFLDPDVNQNNDNKIEDIDRHKELNSNKKIEFSDDESFSIGLEARNDEITIDQIPHNLEKSEKINKSKISVEYSTIDLKSDKNDILEQKNFIFVDKQENIKVKSISVILKEKFGLHSHFCSCSPADFSLNAEVAIIRIDFPSNQKFYLLMCLK